MFAINELSSLKASNDILKDKVKANENFIRNHDEQLAIIGGFYEKIFTWDIINYQQKLKGAKKNNSFLYSDDFQSHPGGYNLRMQTYLNGYTEMKNTHLTVLIQILKGEYDEFLQWPFKAKIEFQLIHNGILV